MNRFWLFLIMLGLTLSVQSQGVDFSYDHHDFSLSYGQFTVDQFQSFKSPLLDEQLPDDRYVRDQVKNYGGIFLSYKSLTKGGNFIWGISAGMDRTSSKVYWVGQEIGTIDRRYYSIAFHADYRYINNGLIQAYSGFGIGYSYVNESLDQLNVEQSDTATSLNKLAYQITAVGLRIGKQFGGFVEFGYGYKGIVNVGISVQMF